MMKSYVNNQNSSDPSHFIDPFAFSSDDSNSDISDNISDNISDTSKGKKDTSPVNDFLKSFDIIYDYVTKLISSIF